MAKVFVIALSIAAVIAVIYQNKTKNQQSHDLIGHSELCLIVRTITESPTPAVKSWGPVVSRKGINNLYNAEIKRYLDEQGKFGLIHGLCDDRPILDGRIPFNPQSMIDSDHVEDPVRYCDVFYYVNALSLGELDEFPANTDKSERNRLIFLEIKKTLKEIEKASGKSGLRYGGLRGGQTQNIRD